MRSLKRHLNEHSQMSTNSQTISSIFNKYSLTISAVVIGLKSLSSHSQKMEKYSVRTSYLKLQNSMSYSTQIQTTYLIEIAVQF